MEDVRMDIWELLEQDAPKGCAAVQDLYSWSLNYDAGKGPFTLFLDLIGWSDENIGEVLYAPTGYSIGYVEAAKLGASLVEYADDPHGVLAYTNELMNAETQTD